MNSPTTHYPPPSFPPAQASLSADGHGMSGDYVAQGAQDGVPRNAIHSLQDVKPYLGLRSRLSQVWINRWTVLIMLVLARLLISLGSLHDGIDNAKDQALAACHTVESLGSNMASLPHYMASGTNELAASGVERAVNGLHSGLFDIVTAVEEIFVFWVNMYIGLYECLITFAVAGSAHLVLEAAAEISTFLNSTLKDVSDGINKAEVDFKNVYNDFLQAFNHISSVTGITPPNVMNVTDQTNTLVHLQLPTGVSSEITKLNSSIPTFDQVKNATNSMLRLPFEEIKKLMNESLGVFSFDRNAFPVPAREQLTFCADNDGINGFFDTLYDVVNTARKIFIAVLIIAAIGACIPMALLEMRRWRSTQAYASRMQIHAVDNIDKVYIASRPFTSNMGIKLSQRFSSQRTQILVRWLIAYITSIPAIVVLSIAIAGLFSCLCQYTVLKAVEKEVPELAADIGQFADKVVLALNNASAVWANGTNHVINNTNNDINKNVFGWVNTSTHAINDTLNFFVDEMITTLNKTFGGTPLYTPIMEVYNCLIGIKVEAIETGLTWVSDHAFVEFPLFPNDTFSAGAQAAVSTNTTTSNGQNNSFLADPGDQATDKVTAAVTKLADKLYKGIRTEAIIATSVLCLYLLVVLMGLGYVLYAHFRSSKTRAEGGATYAGDVAPGMVEDNRGLPSPAEAHIRNTQRDSDLEMSSMQSQHTVPHAFATPMPAPPMESAPPAYERRTDYVGRFAPTRGQNPGTADDDNDMFPDEKMGFAQTTEEVPRNNTGQRNNPFHNSIEKGDMF